MTKKRFVYELFFSRDDPLPRRVCWDLEISGDLASCGPCPKVIRRDLSPAEMAKLEATLDARNLAAPATHR